jgi:EAL domain-containing protein (putative c-di-GMP-specific phosphodiesterase class I)
MIERILKETGVNPAMLDIELTENAVIENSQTAMASLKYLNELGVTLSIDDFGTGYSSLSYVKRLPVHRLKIDQSFVQNLENGTSDEVIVRAIINLGHSLGLRVIGEGVETEGQLARLQRLGCDEVQGDYICPALSVGEFERRLALRQLNAAVDDTVLDFARPYGLSAVIRRYSCLSSTDCRRRRLPPDDGGADDGEASAASERRG